MCICRGITDKQIVSEVEKGAQTFREVRQSLDVGTCCGQCVPETRQLIDDTLTQLAAGLSTAA